MHFVLSKPRCRLEEVHRSNAYSSSSMIVVYMFFTVMIPVTSRFPQGVYCKMIGVQAKCIRIMMLHFARHFPIRLREGPYLLARRMEARTFFFDNKQTEVLLPPGFTWSRLAASAEAYFLLFKCRYRRRCNIFIFSFIATAPVCNAL